jgi:hypothetical protein
MTSASFAARFPSMRCVGFCASILLLLLGARLAHAAGIEAQERTARKACLSGDYTKGVEILSDLFIDTKDPNYIFNQARCFEQNSRYEEAISRFREFLRKATAISPTEKADTEKHIADCQALIGSKESPAPKAEAAPAAAAPVVAKAAPSPAPTVLPPAVNAPEQIAVASSTPPAANPGHGLRVAGIVCGALGVASVGTAIYYYTQAKSYSDKVSGQTIPNPSDESAGKHAQTMQWVLYSVGGAAIATGTVLYVLGWKAADGGQATASVAPMFGPGLAGISAQGAF